MHSDRRILLLVLALSLLALPGCAAREKTVTVYTSVDRNFSEQVFRDFEARTGIRVIAGYDTEASKTTGMVNKLIEEAANPQADVFWNGEFSQTLLLKEKGILMPYQSPSAADIPARYRDPEGYWTAFGGRARVILVNTEKLQPADYPTRFTDFLDPRYPADQIGMAYPLFGTTATHAAALYALQGVEKAHAFYQALQERGLRIVDGNGVVRDLVVDGQLMFGMTDTDDALGAVERGDPVAIVVPDQGADDPGTLIVPNSAALIKKERPNANARAFLDYLLSAETEKQLVEIGWIQAPVRNLGLKPQGGVDWNAIRTIDVPLDQIYAQLTMSQNDLKQIFVR
jgi:iron(III) transport system substrate-binding protein